MGGKASRNKGASSERIVCHIINEALGTDLHRELEQSRSGRNDITLGKYRWEIKRQEKLSIPMWWKQAVASCGDGDVPVLCFRRSREEWKVCITLEELLLLIKHASKDIDFRYERKV